MTKVQQSLSPTYDNEIELRRLFQTIWNGKWLVTSITLASAILGIVVALMLPNIYRAEALLAPNDQERAGGLSTLAAQYGGLASLAGINLESGMVDKTTYGLEVLKSRKFLSEFIARHEILVPLIATRGWNAESGRLEVDEDVYDTTLNKWVRIARPPKKTIPTMQEAYDEFTKILSVRQNKKTGFVTVAVEHYSPVLAQQWVNWLTEDLNATVMQQDVSEAEHAIDYLNKQIEKTPLADLQGVFYRLIEEQTKTVMLARATGEYLFKTVDPAIAPETRSRPKRSMIVFVTTAFGLFLGVGVALFLNRSRSAHSES